MSNWTRRRTHGVSYAEPGNIGLDRGLGGAGLVGGLGARGLQRLDAGLLVGELFDVALVERALLVDALEVGADAALVLGNAADGALDPLGCGRLVGDHAAKPCELRKRRSECWIEGGALGDRAEVLVAGVEDAQRLLAGMLEGEAQALRLAGPQIEG